MMQGIKDILYALKQLQSTIYLACDKKPADDISKIVRDAVAEITSLRAELEIAKKDGWISVDTALPKENTIVIAYTHKVEIRKFCKFKFAEMTSKVTHWQPIPEPPKE